MLILEFSRSRYGRNVLQADSSSDTSQPSFIALLTIISVLTVVLVIIIIVLCYRYYSHQERTFKDKRKYHHKSQQILPIHNNQQSTVPVPTTAIRTSLYPVRSSEQLFSNHYQSYRTSAIDRFPARRAQQSTMNAYLNDLNSFQSAKIDVKQLNSYLFIDLHSTSSETFPENISKVFSNNATIGAYYRSARSTNSRKYDQYLKQKRLQSLSTLKQSYGSRFLMRERSLPNNLHKLPQLRQTTTQSRNDLRINNFNSSDATMTMNQGLQLMNVTDNYHNNHIYHVNQKQIIKNIDEEKLFTVQQNNPLYSYSRHYNQQPYLFQKVSISPGDDIDIEIPYTTFASLGNRDGYMNDSILV